MKLFKKYMNRLIKSLSSVILISTILFSNDINLVEHYNELGVKNLNKIKQGLLNRGILESQINPVLRGMTRVIKVVKIEGYDFEMDPKMKIYFLKKVGINESQLEYVKSISVRIAHRSH